MMVRSIEIEQIIQVQWRVEGFRSTVYDVKLKFGLEKKRRLK
jgi:hypothetical protein